MKLIKRGGISMPQVKVGIIGGSGLYEIEGMSDLEEIIVTTPFGDPSDVITIGRIEQCCQSAQWDTF